MAFLDNSGDIILDAVLTDTGRMRLARGDGSFKIAKYAFGDDEIDYSNFDATNTSGSAYYDLQILQTPVFEAFTNNTATMKSKLITLTNNNLLYLPLIKLNETANYAPNSDISSGSHAILVDSTSVTQFGEKASPKSIGNFINGFNPSPGDGGIDGIRLDQGIDSTEISAVFALDPELKETQYIVEMDNRFGQVTDINGVTATPAFIDDDNIASYYLSGEPYVKNTPAKNPTTGDSGDEAASTIAGPRGTHIEFKVRSSINLRTSTFLFDQVGSTSTFGAKNFYYIDTIIKVNGATTGYKIDVPVRFIKYYS